MKSLKDELVLLGAGGHALAQQVLGNRDEAADAVHDVIAQVLEKPGSYNSKIGPLKPWFLALVRNRCIDVLRVRGRTVELSASTPHPVTEPNALQDTLENQDKGDRVVLALTQLSTDQRQLIVLRDHLDLSYTHIARVIGVPKGTVMSKLHRARLALRKAYEELVK